jgi:hypothetical protein
VIVLCCSCRPRDLLEAGLAKLHALLTVGAAAVNEVREALMIAA